MNLEDAVILVIVTVLSGLIVYYLTGGRQA